MEKSENKTVTCSSCQGVFTRIQIGEKYKNRHARYHDEQGRAWKGKKCPTCARNYHKLLQRKLRENKVGNKTDTMI